LPAARRRWSRVRAGGRVGGAGGDFVGRQTAGKLGVSRAEGGLGATIEGGRTSSSEQRREIERSELRKHSATGPENDLEIGPDDARRR
jgi:hypothetical protein